MTAISFLALLLLCPYLCEYDRVESPSLQYCILHAKITNYNVNSSYLSSSELYFGQEMYRGGAVKVGIVWQCIKSN